jgi:uncharacterized phage-associated protein
MKITLPRLKAILLYFCDNTDKSLLGKVKLMKLFYFLDFLMVKNYGIPITFDRYVKMEHGPVPSTILNLVDTVETDFDSAELADTITVVREECSDRHRIVGKDHFTKQHEILFSKQELIVMAKVCARFGEMNAKNIEYESHQEAPFQKTEYLNDIDYALAADDPDCLVSKEVIELSLQI